MVDDILSAFSKSIPNSSGWVRTRCPRCEDAGHRDHKESLAINANTGWWQCWRCHEKGKIDTNDWVPLENTALQLSDLSHPPDGYVPLWEGLGLNSLATEKARIYLMSRGILYEEWRDNQLGVCLGGKYQNRIVIPLLYHREWRGFVSRSYLPTTRPYMYPPGFHRYIYREELLYARTSIPVIVVEGVFDALPHKHTIACLGKPTKEQLETLSRANRPIVVALDGDSWQEGKALSLRLKLRGKETGFIKLPAGKDPGDIHPDWLSKKALESL